MLFFAGTDGRWVHAAATAKSGGPTLPEKVEKASTTATLTWWTDPESVPMPTMRPHVHPPSSGAPIPDSQVGFNWFQCVHAIQDLHHQSAGSFPVHSWLLVFCRWPRCKSIGDDQRETRGARALQGVTVEVVGWKLRKAWLTVAAACLPSCLSVMNRPTVRFASKSDPLLPVPKQNWWWVCACGAESF